MSKILFFAPFGLWGVHHQLDAVFAAALRQRGCETLGVRCDGLFRSACDVLSWSGSSADQDCATCKLSGDHQFAALGLQSVQLRALIQQEEWTKAIQWVDTLDPADYMNAVYEGWPVGKWVISSVCTFFRITASELHRPEVRKIHRLHLVHSLVTAWGVKRLIEAYNPTAIFIFNGRFALYRVALEIAKLLNVRVLTHERGFSDATFAFFGQFNSISAQPLYECDERWGHIPLDHAELTSAKQFLVNRAGGKDFNWPAFYDYRTANTQVRRLLQIPADAPLVAAFTSSEFEIAYCDDFPSVNQQLDWVQNLIELFRGRKEYLIIRHHPNIAGTDRASADTNFISRAYKQTINAPSNVRIVMPSEQLTSYALIPYLSACFAFYSTIGMETSARGVPTTCYIESPFRPAFSSKLTQGSKSELGEALERMLKYSDDDRIRDMRLAYRFLYNFSQRFSMRFKNFGIKETYNQDIRLQTTAQLEVGYDPLFDDICNYMLHGTHWIRPPGQQELNRSAEYETSFYNNELKELDRLHRECRKVESTLERSNGLSNVLLIGIGEGSNRKTTQLCARHKLVDTAHIPNDLNWKSASTQISNLIQSSNCEYVLVAAPGAQYDQAFLPSAIEILRNSSHKGVSYAGWLIDSQQMISGEVFTTRRPLSDFGSALVAIPTLNLPFYSLSFGLYSRTWLLETIASLLKEEHEYERGYALFTQLRSEAVRQLPIPLVQIDSRFSSVREQTVIVQSNEQLRAIDLAIGLAQKKNYEEALRAVHIARSADLPMRDADYIAALCLAQTGHLSRARAAAARELIHYPDHKGAQELLETL